MERSESRRGPSEDRSYSPVLEQPEERLDLDDNGADKPRESSRHRSKDKKKSRRDEKDHHRRDEKDHHRRDEKDHHRRDEKDHHRRDEKDHHRSKDRERSKGTDGLRVREKDPEDKERERVSSRENRREERDDRDKDRTKDKVREKDYERDKHADKGRERDKDRKDRGKERDYGRGAEMENDNELMGRDKESGKEKGKDRGRDRERGKDKEREKEKEKPKDQEEREYDKDRSRVSAEIGNAKEKFREKERNDREKYQDKERATDRDKVSKRIRDDGHHASNEGGRDDRKSLDGGGKDAGKPRKDYDYDLEENSTIEHDQKAEVASGASHLSAADLSERISKMKGERIKNQSTGGSEVLSWVSKSRKLEDERKAEKAKAFQLSRILEEQDNVYQEDSEDESEAKPSSDDLAGVKVLHGLDKVAEGGAVVLTLKDQNILAGGGINEEVDMLENVEIGEQKQRDEAYGAAKRKKGIYEDKFNDEPGSAKRMLPQYDDPAADEGLTLDARGRIPAEAEKKLEELRKRIHGATANNQFEDLNSASKISSDYYTQEEMLRFKKPKKKKSIRKKEKLDIDALEAEAVAAGFGASDLGSRNDGKRQAMREEQERSETETKNKAYQSAYAKADEASKALRFGQTLPVQVEEDEVPVFGSDDEDLHKSLERARKLALIKQEESIPGPKAVAMLASATVTNEDEHHETAGEMQENKVIFTEMEEFVWGLQLDHETQKPDKEDVFMDEDELPKVSDEAIIDEAGGWKEVNDVGKHVDAMMEDKEAVVPDDTIHEAAVGKGLSGALSLLKERGALKETVDWGGRNMDKKKGKLVGIHDNEGPKEINLERTDEYGRVLTPKEAFRIISHKFHGKAPGKTKQEKRMKQYQDDLKLKQMKNSDTPSMSVERMREAQAQLKTPYLVLSGNVKPGQTSDPKSGFATVEKDLPGGLTPMLGDRKVEHFLGIKRKPDSGTMPPPKKLKS